MQAPFSMHTKGKEFEVKTFKGKHKNMVLWCVTVAALTCFTWCAFSMEADVTVARVVGSVVSASWIVLFCSVNEKKLTV